MFLFGMHSEPVPQVSTLKLRLATPLKTVWYPDQLASLKPADLDLHCFQFQKSCVHIVFTRLNMVGESGIYKLNETYLRRREGEV